MVRYPKTSILLFTAIAARSSTDHATLSRPLRGLHRLRWTTSASPLTRSAPIPPVTSGRPTPPSITKLSVQAARTRLSLSFGLSDNRSGIDADRLVARLNGEFLVVEYDPCRHRVHYEGHHSLPTGTHVLSIEAADRMGNTRRVVQTVRVR